MQNKTWDERGIRPAALRLGSKYGAVPVFGIEINQRFDLFGKTFLKVNNVITPLITNHTISLGMDF